MKFFIIATIFILNISANSDELPDAKSLQKIIDEQEVFDETKIIFRYLHLTYTDHKIKSYFVVSGFEKNKIKFDEVDPKAILSFESYLNDQNKQTGTVVFKTTEYCLAELAENKKTLDLFKNESGVCDRWSKIENLSPSVSLFWFKKIYFTYRDFIDWL